MRLTPSWFGPSSEPADEERAGTPDGMTGVTMIRGPENDFSASDSGDDRCAGEFLPESDRALLSVLDGMNTPATVDEVADELVKPARPPIETWATIHEQLHQDRLPALDASGAVEFDETQGLVERSATRSSVTLRFSAPLLAAISIGFLLIFIGLVSVSVVVA
ncbi:hypothetical protein [Natrinema salaciae]|uniref:Uncharacterized protein n=1 Tax=Natrinema salaciae TaxID=1186196 RepID=A0A1H9GXN8_9EURY|nr:hypothetical protein [Natrinema salaciae]SEQ54800.1 hypothetical protein SAMN04489841_2027 [Natrinema salaciae]